MFGNWDVELTNSWKSFVALGDKGLASSFKVFPFNLPMQVCHQGWPRQQHSSYNFFSCSNASLVWGPSLIPPALLSAQVAQRGCGVSLLWYIQMSPGHGLRQPALGSPVWAGVGPDDLQTHLPTSTILWNLCLSLNFSIVFQYFGAAINFPL